MTWQQRNAFWLEERLRTAFGMLQLSQETRLQFQSGESVTLFT